MQIDVVGHRDDNITDLGECKWGEVRPAEAARQLRATAEKYPNARNATLGHRLFTRQHSMTDLPGVKVYALEDLYDARQGHQAEIEQLQGTAWLS